VQRKAGRVVTLVLVRVKCYIPVKVTDLKKCKMELLSVTHLITLGMFRGSEQEA